MRFQCEKCKGPAFSPVKRYCGAIICIFCLQEEASQPNPYLCCVCNMPCGSTQYWTPKELKKLKTHTHPCSYSDEGCQQSPTLLGFKHHLRVCPYLTTSCPDCSEQVLRHAMHLHRTSCSHRPVKCPDCGCELSLVDLKHHIDQEHTACTSCSKPIVIPRDSPRHELVRCRLCSKAVSACSLAAHVPMHASTPGLMADPRIALRNRQDELSLAIAHSSDAHKQMGHVESRILARFSRAVRAESRYISLRVSESGDVEGRGIVTVDHPGVSAGVVEWCIHVYPETSLVVGVGPPLCVEPPNPGHRMLPEGLYLEPRWGAVTNGAGKTISKKKLILASGDVVVRLDMKRRRVGWRYPQLLPSVTVNIKSPLPAYTLSVGMDGGKARIKWFKRFTDAECVIVKCPHSEAMTKPCSWTGFALDLPAHLGSECIHHPIACPNACFGCPAKIPRKLMSRHLNASKRPKKSRIPVCRVVRTCPGCKKKTGSSADRSQHLNECRAFKQMVCTFSGITLPSDVRLSSSNTVSRAFCRGERHIPRHRSWGVPAFIVIPYPAFGKGHVAEWSFQISSANPSFVGLVPHDLPPSYPITSSGVGVWRDGKVFGTPVSTTTQGRSSLKRKKLITVKIDFGASKMSWFGEGFRQDLQLERRHYHVLIGMNQDSMLKLLSYKSY
eukprot:gnl/Dysnectes_brevis/3818_a4917_643.p1 GENE.gnl/Dysnectes_brevis/3818_a4917_643~~gnl/Dysnectes_brevis/3818_a4917_643.p1  ORF type:complete len:668 (-),score=117.92 gnl/Dysnectes_brevis/3818_a4917_643:53-2056(-)